MRMSVSFLLLIIFCNLIPCDRIYAQQEVSRSSVLQQFTGSPEASPQLTRGEAEEMALKRNPRVSVSHLLALAEHQVVRESRSAELPTFDGSITGEEAHNASRIASGSLSDSRLFEHAGGGVTMSQLITDFGHTSHLVASSRLRERAQNASELATREDIVLATDAAFYNALQAQSLLRVAQQTVATRQATEAQVGQLTRNKLRSTLDLSFADVAVSQARLLQLDATNNANATMAALDEVLGLDHEVLYRLVENTAAAPPPPPDVNVLIQTALRQRPDLQSLQYTGQAEHQFSRAQEDQKLPTISALGTLGGTPVRPGQYFDSSWDGAIAGNINIPIFNGFLFSAEAKEAHLRATAADEQSRELRDRIVRDVHTAWLDATNAFQRIGVTAELLNESNQSLALAETRYRLGLSSIVELSQAQLQQTQADIGHTNAEYQYRLSLAALGYQVGNQP